MYYSCDPYCNNQSNQDIALNGECAIDLDFINEHKEKFKVFGASSNRGLGDIDYYYNKGITTIFSTPSDIPLSRYIENPDCEPWDLEEERQRLV